MTSIFFFFFFLFGILTGKFFSFTELQKFDYKTYVLYILLFFVGIQIGSEKRVSEIFKNINFKYLLFPFISLLGTIFFSFFVFLIFRFPIKEGITIVSGMGYYSLSSILVSEIKGEFFGIITLMTNLLREIETIIFAPFLIRIFGKSSLIASGGATTVDTTLPVIIKWGGKEYLLLSIINGFLLSLFVPIFIIFILSIK
ncbi:MAG: lysine exporter LysO family protein [candidate division WOR-3 bacterium]